MSSHFLAGSVALLLAAAPQASTPHARGPRAASPNDPIVIPLRRLGESRLRAVRVRVGDDTLDFLFDTGNGTTLLGRDVAARVGCRPGGRAVGFRMTGEKLAGDTCADLRLDVGGIPVTATAGVVDMAALLGRPVDAPPPPVHGVVSLAAFAGRAITLDLAHDRLVVETPASLASRTRTMRELPARLATGTSGADLDLFVGLRARGVPLWFEWDSGHQAPTFLAPHAARLLGVADSVTRADAALPILARDTAVAPVMVKDIIYDGVLSAGFLERAVWAVDLARGRAWVGPIAPIPSLPTVSDAPVIPPASDPAGIYETAATVGGRVQHGVLSIVRDGGTLRGRIRGVGEEGMLELREVSIQGNELRYALPLREPAPVRVTFDGLTGTGTWGDSAGRGGALRVVKRR